MFKRTIHLAGYVGGADSGQHLTIDGQFAGPVISNATFDYFTGGGVYFAAGSLTEMHDPACNIPQ